MRGNTAPLATATARRSVAITRSVRVMPSPTCFGIGFGCPSAAARCEDNVTSAHEAASIARSGGCNAPKAHGWSIGRQDYTHKFREAPHMKVVSLEEVDDEVDKGSRPCDLHEHEEGEQNDAPQSLPWRSLCGRALCQALFPSSNPGALSLRRDSTLAHRRRQGRPCASRSASPFTPVSTGERVGLSGRRGPTDEQRSKAPVGEATGRGSVTGSAGPARGLDLGGPPSLRPETRHRNRHHASPS